MADLNADDIAYDIVQANQDKMAKWVDSLLEDLCAREFTQNECNSIDSELTRDLEIEALKVLESAISDVLEERERREAEEADKITFHEMSEETRAWAENQVLPYGNVVFRIEDGKLLPGIDFSELNIVLGNAEDTLVKVRNALLKKVNDG